MSAFFILLEQYLDGDSSVVRADNPKNWNISLSKMTKKGLGNPVWCTIRELRKHPNIWKRMIAKDGC